MNINGKKLSNSKVLWLVSSLFVVTASQCGLKKEANNRGPANSADRSSEGMNETSGKNVVEEIPDKDKMPGNSDSDSDRYSEFQNDSALAGFNVDGESHTPSGGQDTLVVDQIKDVAKRLGERIESIRNVSDFTSVIRDSRSPLSETYLTHKVWDGYYKPCSKIWIYLEYLNLSSVDEVGQRLDGQNQDKDALSLLLDLVRFLSNSAVEKTTYYKESTKKNSNTQFVYGNYFEAFINKNSDFRQGMNDLIEYLKSQSVTDSARECAGKIGRIGGLF